MSNDNPYAEAAFKTLKYRPDWPARFDSLEDATAHCEQFFGWYNNEHHHSGIGMLTPADRHGGHGQRIDTARQAVLDAAYQAHPERFPNGRPHRPTSPHECGSTPPNYTLANHPTHNQENRQSAIDRLRLAGVDRRMFAVDSSKGQLRRRDQPRTRALLLGVPAFCRTTDRRWVVLPVDQPTPPPRPSPRMLGPHHPGHHRARPTPPPTPGHGNITISA
ncbi:MAG: transposase [Candidatus Microthrix sp.]|nr:transposase [Candidatus Microthrix sp.]